MHDGDIQDIIKASAEQESAELDHEYCDREIPTVHAESSMSYWWPKTRNLDVPQPRTIRVPVDERPMIEMIDGGPIPNLDEMCQAASDIGYPVFVRNNITSAKHDWKDSCYLGSQKDLPRHVYAITDYTLGMSMGEMQIDSMFFREFIQLEMAGFSCFGGDFPVSKEVRCFVRDGKLECRHPYWFPEVFEREIEMHVRASRHMKEMDAEAGSAGAPAVCNDEIFPSDWRARLDRVNRLTAGDNDTIMSHLSTIAPHFVGYWSVDFAKGTNGTWYLTDMARGEVSYHYERCPECGHS